MTGEETNQLEYVQLNSHKEVTDLDFRRKIWNVVYFFLLLVQLTSSKSQSGIYMLSLPGMYLQFLHINRYRILRATPCLHPRIGKTPQRFANMERGFLGVTFIFGLGLRLAQVLEKGPQHGSHPGVLAADVMLTIAYLVVTCLEIGRHSSNVYWVLKMEALAARSPKHSRN